MSVLRAYYAPSYAPADSATLSRLALAARMLERDGLAELHAPPAFDTRLLDGLHDAGYVQAFLHGGEPLASSQGLRWSPAIRDATLAMLSGQLEAARHALAHGVAMNLARGFHHAVPERGSGYCAINGLALTARQLPDQRVLVVDCDEHGGNGTEEFAARLPNLYNVSIFGTRFGCHGGIRSWAYQVRVAEQGFAAYRQALHEVRVRIEEIAPQLIIYQAGVDCHVDDPKNTVGLSTRQLALRDSFVFEVARERGIPLVFLVAGGYQASHQVARLNLGTVRSALRVFGLDRVGASSCLPVALAYTLKSPDYPPDE